MSEINESTVNSGEPIVKTGSSSDAISFDDLEAVTTSSKDFKPHEDEVPKAKSQKKKAVDADDVDDEPKELKEVKGDEDPKAAKKVEAGKEGDQSQPKMLKIMNGDKPMDIPSNAKLTIKVNGKDETFEVQELVNEFSGKTNWGRKYQELDTERKTFDTERKTFNSERQELQSGIDELFDLAVTKNKPMDAVQLLSDMLGGDGIKTVNDLRERMFKEFEELSKLTPEQREIRKAQEEKAIIESKLKRHQATEAKKSEQTEIAKRVQEIKTKHNMDDARFNEVYDTLKKSGNIKAEELTPELIGAVSDRWLQMDHVDEIVGEMQLDGEIGANAKTQLLTEWAKDKTLTKDQIKAIATNVFGGKLSKKQGTLADKIKRNGQANSQPAKAVKQEREVLTFDDLD